MGAQCGATFRQSAAVPFEVVCINKCADPKLDSHDVREHVTCPSAPNLLPLGRGRGICGHLPRHLTGYDAVIISSQVENAEIKVPEYGQGLHEKAGGRKERWWPPRLGRCGTRIQTMQADPKAGRGHWAAAFWPCPANGQLCPNYDRISCVPKAPCQI